MSCVKMGLALVAVCAALVGCRAAPATVREARTGGKPLPEKTGGAGSTPAGTPSVKPSAEALLKDASIAETAYAKALDESRKPPNKDDLSEHPTRGAFINKNRAFNSYGEASQNYLRTRLNDADRLAPGGAEQKAAGEEIAQFVADWTRKQSETYREPIEELGDRPIPEVAGMWIYMKFALGRGLALAGKVEEASTEFAKVIDEIDPLDFAKGLARQFSTHYRTKCIYYRARAWADKATVSKDKAHWQEALGSEWADIFAGEPGTDPVVLLKSRILRAECRMNLAQLARAEADLRQALADIDKAEAENQADNKRGLRATTCESLRSEVRFVQDRIEVLRFEAGVKADPSGAGEGSEATGPSFTLDGKPFRPYSCSLSGEPDRIAPGDTIVVNDIMLTLGEGRAFAFKTTPDEDGRLLVVEAGRERAVGAKVGWTYKKDDKVVFNPLAKLSDQEIKGLWGLRLDEWPEGTEEKLKLIDPERSCVTVTDKAARGERKSFPRLPIGLRYLQVEERSNSGIKDYSPMAAMPSLRLLIVDSMTAPFDAALIRNARELRYLDLHGTRLAHAGELKALSGVRSLNVCWNLELEDIGFVAAMKQLRQLDLRHTAVADLGPLAGLDQLVSVNADTTKVSKLPAGRLPALKTLRVMAASVGAADAAAFAKANPGCQVIRDWNEALAAAVAGTTRVRVRSGGTCCRRVEDERTLFVERKPKGIAALLACLKVDEKRSNFECKCCGDPTLEFYKEGILTASVGFHHGQSIRWPGGWPGDGMLTEDSAAGLSKWLDGHGVKGPAKERERSHRDAEAARRLAERISQVLPKEVAEALDKAKAWEERSAAFGKVADPVDRAVMYFRLLGCRQDYWSAFRGDEMLVSDTLLPALDAQTTAQAVGKAAGDPFAADGATRWVLGLRKWRSVDAKGLEAAIPTLAANGLGHPTTSCRRDTIIALEEIKTEAAIQALRKCLKGEYQVRQAAVEAGGAEEPGPGKDQAGETLSDRAHAALALAKLGDKQSLAAIRELAVKVSADDRKLVEQALKLLEAEGK